MRVGRVASAVGPAARRADEAMPQRIVEEAQRGRWPHAAATRSARGGCGRRLRRTSSPMRCGIDSSALLLCSSQDPRARPTGILGRAPSSTAFHLCLRTAPLETACYHSRFGIWTEPFVVMFTSCAPLAQLDRASGYEPGGRRFESCRARQFSPSPERGASRHTDTGLRLGREALGDRSSAARAVHAAGAGRGTSSAAGR